MDAKFVAHTLGMVNQYNQAIEKIGEMHSCNQGCGEGRCSWYESAHQMEIVREMAKINQQPQQGE